MGACHRVPQVVAPRAETSKRVPADLPTNSNSLTPTVSMKHAHVTPDKFGTSLGLVATGTIRDVDDAVDTSDEAPFVTCAVVVEDIIWSLYVGW